MHGKYKCAVKTDLGSREMEQELVVISQSNCKIEDWRVTSQANECRETFKFDCRNMFPKPVTSCGLWNSKLDKFIRSVMVDISEEPNKQTFRIKYSGKFELPPHPSGIRTSRNGSSVGNSSDSSNGSFNDDLLQFAGHLMFKCDIIVPETSWKSSLTYRMFDYNEGCLQDPLDTIERMRLNYSHYATTRMQQAGYFATKDLDDFEMLASNLKYELLPSSPGKPLKVDCWHKPRLGSLARLSCANRANQARLVGASLLECRPEGWMPVSGSLQKKTLKKLPRARRPPRPSRGVNTTEPSDTLQGKSRFEDGDTTSDASAELVSTNSQLPDTNNDLEESHPSTLTTTSLTASQPLEIEFIPTNQKILSSLGLQTQSTELVQPSTLTPAQLAALLPTCVSNRRAHISSTIVSNRLPLLDEARILESSSGPNSRNKQLRNNNQDKSFFNSFFNFSSSGSIGTLGTIKHGKQFITLVIFLATLIELRLILDMQRQMLSI